MNTDKVEKMAETLKPTMHMNGTGKRDLVEGWRAVSEAATALREALFKLEFNARDYYVRGSEAWPAADDAMKEIASSVHIVEGVTELVASQLEQERQDEEDRKKPQAEPEPVAEAPKAEVFRCIGTDIKPEKEHRQVTGGPEPTCSCGLWFEKVEG